MPPKGLLNRLEQQEAPAVDTLHEPHADTPPERYDLNFSLPIFDELRTVGIRLVPYVPSIHARMDFELFKQAQCADVWRYLPYGPFATYHDWLVLVEKWRERPDHILLAVFDTADDPMGSFVGTFAYIRADPEHLSTELGIARIHPMAQRTHVTTQTIGVMLQHAFEVWKLRRVQYIAHHYNYASQHAALRMGFQKEGVLRWHMNQPFSKASVDTELVVAPDSSYATPSAGVGRHSVLFSMTWRDWEESQKAHVQRLVDREPVKRKSVS